MKAYIGRHIKKTGEQKVSVRIDPWDTYDCLTTLAHIILPLIREFRVQRLKVPGVPTAFLPENYDGSDAEHAVAEARYNEILDRIEWSFSEVANGYPGEDKIDINDPNWKTTNFEYHAKIQDGFDLFGKHLTALWW